MSSSSPSFESFGEVPEELVDSQGDSSSSNTNVVWVDDASTTENSLDGTTLSGPPRRTSTIGLVPKLPTSVLSIDGLIL